MIPNHQYFQTNFDRINCLIEFVINFVHLSHLGWLELEAIFYWVIIYPSELIIFYPKLSKFYKNKIITSSKSRSMIKVYDSKK